MDSTDFSGQRLNQLLVRFGSPSAAQIRHCCLHRKYYASHADKRRWAETIFIFRLLTRLWLVLWSRTLMSQVTTAIVSTFLSLADYSLLIVPSWTVYQIFNSSWAGYTLSQPWLALSGFHIRSSRNTRYSEVALICLMKHGPYVFLSSCTSFR